MSERLALHGGAPVRTEPFPEWPVFGAPEEEALLRTLRSGHWGKLSGEETARFEAEFARYQDARHGIAVVNGTAALRVALLACGIEAGDEVILPPYTFVASATAVVSVNAVPVFADIDPDSYCLDPAAAERAITPRTKAIIAVHLGGQPADLAALRALADRRGVFLIEDASHAHGAIYRGRKVGAIGHLGAFSFQASKNLNGGEGGIVLTNDDALAARARAWHDCGRGVDEPILGDNLRLTEFQAAILRAQMTRLEAQTCQRAHFGAALNARLAAIPGIAPFPLDETSRHGYHIWVCRYDPAAWDGVPRESFLAALRAEGIPVGPGYATPLYDFEVFINKRFGPFASAAAGYADVAVHRANCPVCEHASKVEGWWTKQSVLLSGEQGVDDIARAIEKLYRGRKELTQ